MNLLSESLESLQKPSLENEETCLIEKLQEHGDRGDSIAQFSLAKVYLKEGELEKALHYLYQAVKQGDIQAIYQLAVLKYEGVGTKLCPVINLFAQIIYCSIYLKSILYIYDYFNC